MFLLPQELTKCQDLFRRSGDIVIMSLASQGTTWKSDSMLSACKDHDSPSGCVSITDLNKALVFLLYVFHRETSRSITCFFLGVPLLFLVSTLFFKCCLYCQKWVLSRFEKYWILREARTVVSVCCLWSDETYVDQHASQTWLWDPFSLTVNVLTVSRKTREQRGW